MRPRLLGGQTPRGVYETHDPHHPPNATRNPSAAAGPGAAWNAVSQDYARGIDPQTSAFAQHALDQAPPDASSRVLDVAAGAGALALRAAATAKRVVAVDIAPSLLDILRSRARDAGIHNVDARAMDGEALDLEDGSFDRAYSLFGVIMFPRPTRGLEEMHRVLRPGGAAVVSTLGHVNPMRPIQQAAGSVLSGLPRPPSPALADEATLRDAMEAAGFARVQVKKQHRVGRFESLEEYWNAMTLGNPPLRALRQRLTPEQEAAVRAATARQLDAPASGPVGVPVDALHATGWKPGAD